MILLSYSHVEFVLQYWTGNHYCGSPDKKNEPIAGYAYSVLKTFEAEPFLQERSHLWTLGWSATQTEN